MSANPFADLNARLAASPFGGFLGLSCIEADAAAGRAVLALPWRAELERNAGADQAHGGVIAALIDTAGYYALVVRGELGCPTINFRADYLRPANRGALRAEAIVRHGGRQVRVVDINVTDEAGRLVAIGRGTYGPPPSAG